MTNIHGSTSHTGIRFRSSSWRASGRRYPQTSYPSENQDVDSWCSMNSGCVVWRGSLVVRGIFFTPKRIVWSNLVGHPTVALTCAGLHQKKIVSGTTVIARGNCWENIYHIFSSPIEGAYTHLLSHDTTTKRGPWLRDKYEYLKLELRI